MQLDVSNDRADNMTWLGCKRQHGAATYHAIYENHSLKATPSSSDQPNTIDLHSPGPEQKPAKNNGTTCIFLSKIKVRYTRGGANDTRSNLG